MVNNGRSRGCITCKRRRVRCDQEKPTCRQCRRLQLPCEGYKIKFKFKEQNHRFALFDTERIPISPSTPDTTIDFFFRHYAGFGRNIESGRGFFETIISAYRSQPYDSALSNAVAALSSLTSSIWRYHNLRPSRILYLRAVASLRRAIADSDQVNKPVTLMAGLALQTYDNIIAIYHLRLAQRIHYDGAISLFSLAEPGLTDSFIAAHARNFILHVEIASALRQKRPIQDAINLCLKSRAIMHAPHNPSVTLDSIMAAIAGLQAAHWLPQSRQTGKDLRAETRRVDFELLAWARSVPECWKPFRLASGQGIHSSIPTYMGLCDTYPSCQVANLWNLWRIQRLVLFTLESFHPTSHIDRSRPGEEHILDGIKQVVQELVDSVCQSVPYYLGNRTRPMTIADFGDPEIQLLNHPSTALADDKEYEEHHHHGMPSDGYRSHIIAQGPWHLMSPLSRLLTLFSEQAMTANLLRPGQHQWIRTQFLRVLTVLHISPSKFDIESNITADFLAKEVRQGAMFMSGP
ncbi:hypothetical protein EJ04DRAFT_539967 [Polyplosphaeria fusca]|uniref:Zn(2)-C6 fungal-type domain-containing protein n=1 Tax=Polyplosphaeria fusca TaxID=682080 RepID=A0A9P4R9V0_9PLEO|nr:hypothetical protein EJ04DRAFT_539967 [Polyplosphaeria fusca]